MSLVWGYMGNVCFVQPLDPEVAVEVGGGFALAGMDVVFERILHVHSEQAPDCASGQLKKARNEKNSRITNGSSCSLTCPMLSS